MAGKSNKWAAFPHDTKAFAYAGDALKKAWPLLHAGDCEPFPDAKHAAALLKAAGKSSPKLDAESLASALQDAWRAFHHGDFQAAFDAGEKLGAVGASVAVKALGIHATYLVDDEAEQLARYEQVGKLAEAAIAALPGKITKLEADLADPGLYSRDVAAFERINKALEAARRELSSAEDEWRGLEERREALEASR